jgi:hypothetical protein
MTQAARRENDGLPRMTVNCGTSANAMSVGDPRGRVERLAGLEDVQEQRH